METVRRLAWYPLPENFRRMRQVNLYYGGLWYPVRQISPEDMKLLYDKRHHKDDPSLGMPVYFATTNKMYLYPIPADRWEVGLVYDSWEDLECRRL